MKNKEKQNLKSLIKSISSKKEQGITLVALVVTIIVLLILAGVAINMALGDNGLFKKAKEAVNAWKEAEENETGVLDYLYTEWDNIINRGSMTKPITPPEEPPKQEESVLIGDTVDNIKLPKNTETPTTVTIGGEDVTIPPKFTIAEDSGKTVSEGIAVVDPQGNEWVWVPCYVEGGKGNNITGRIKYDRHAFTRTSPTWKYGQTKLTEKDSDGSYKIVRTDDTSYYFHEDLSVTSPEYLSIKQYGGYYIGRYEAGDKDLSELETPRLRTSSDGITHKVSINKNQAPYNWVTQKQSITLSEGMTSTDGTDTNKLNGTQVFTKLCSSYSWDTAIIFIQKTHTAYGSDSKQGNYYDTTFSYKDITGATKTKNKNTEILIPTGQTTPVCSIYDMGGNVAEYTTESCTYKTGKYTNRGGTYDNEIASDIPAGFRGHPDGSANVRISFRTTLFVK